MSIAPALHKIEDELRELITDSWRLKAPKRVLKAFDEQADRG